MLTPLVKWPVLACAGRVLKSDIISMYRNLFPSTFGQATPYPEGRDIVL